MGVISEKPPCGYQRLPGHCNAWFDKLLLHGREQLERTLLTPPTPTTRTTRTRTTTATTTMIVATMLRMFTGAALPNKAIILTGISGCYRSVGFVFRLGAQDVVERSMICTRFQWFAKQGCTELGFWDIQALQG